MSNQTNLSDIQEAFDIIVKGLLEQGRPSVTYNRGCAYRNEDNDKCAVGFLIPDSEYSPEMEGRTPATIAFRWANSNNWETKKYFKDLDFLIQIQSAHDESAKAYLNHGTDMWMVWIKARLQDLANRFSLEWRHG